MGSVTNITLPCEILSLISQDWSRDLVASRKFSDRISRDWNLLFIRNLHKQAIA